MNHSRVAGNPQSRRAGEGIERRPKPIGFDFIWKGPVKTAVRSAAAVLKLVMISKRQISREAAPESSQG
jgi:hypothetical protein